MRLLPLATGESELFRPTSACLPGASVAVEQEPNLEHTRSSKGPVLREAPAGVAVGEEAPLEAQEAEDRQCLDALSGALCISALVEDPPASTPVELPESQPEAEAVHPDQLECHKAHEDSESLNRLHYARSSRNVVSSGQ